MGEKSSKMAAVAPVIVEATAKHTATVIFLHGLGDTGHGWASQLTHIRKPYMKIICPTASTMPVTLNGGFRMPSWFDLLSLNENSTEDEPGIKAARDKIHQLIDNEVSAGIQASRVVVGGFSQGGALALYSAFTRKESLGGVVALSCWLPLRQQFPGAALGNTGTPILQCHGDCDPLVPFKFGQATAVLVKKFNPALDFKTYSGVMHSTSDEEMNDVGKFIASRLPSI